MAKILCVSDGTMRSVLYAEVELARRLAAAGHRVTLAARPAAQTTARVLVELQDVASGRLEFVPLGEAGDTETFIDTLRALEPDLVLVNGEMHEEIIVCLGAGVRLALLNSFCPIWRRPGLPPPHRLVRPGVGVLGGRVGTALLWLDLRVRKALRRLVQQLRTRGRDRVSRLRRLARTHGVDLARWVDTSQWLIPWTYRDLPVLSLHSLAFEFPHEPPPRVTFTGPMVLRRRGGDTGADLVPRLAPGDRLLYAAFGSAFTADLELLGRLVQVVDERPSWHLVLSLGGQLEPAELARALEHTVGPLPARVHAVRWAPQLRMLRRADVAIIHGGINTIDECVLHGVPMLVYCGYETDMAGSTMRVVHHGLGLAGDPRDSTRTMREQLDRLLDEPEFRHRVQAMRRRYMADRRERVAERAVARLLDAPAPATGEPWTSPP